MSDAKPDELAQLVADEIQQANSNPMDTPPSHDTNITEFDIAQTDTTDSTDVESVDENKKTALTDKEVSYVAHIQSCCEAADGFDIFQLLAINADNIGVVKNDELHERNKYIGSIKYISSVIKGVLTGCTQVIGISIIMVDFVREGLIKKYGSVDEAWDAGVCNTSHDEYEEDTDAVFYRFLLTVLAFLFSSFLAYFSMGHLLHIEKGMYKNMNYAKDLNWMNSIWLSFGFVINIVVSIISVYGSFVVIYFSDNALDMVLNSVALFWIGELDDMLVQPEDYTKISKYIEKKKYKYAVSEERNQGCCWRCFNNITYCCGWMYALPFQILRYGTIALCVVLPFVVGYCY